MEHQFYKNKSIKMRNFMDVDRYVKSDATIKILPYS